MDHTPESLPSKYSKYAEYLTNFSEEQELRRMVDFQKKVKTEIQKLRDQYDSLEAEERIFLEDNTEDGQEYNENLFNYKM